MPVKKRFTSKEIALLRALQKKKVPFIIVGMSAAVLQGAPFVTQDIDLWVQDMEDPKFSKALDSVGGFYVPPFGNNSPQMGGDGLELVDLVFNADGLRSFEYEYKHSCLIKLGRLTIRVLPLERILKSKKAAGRKKDKAVIPALEDTIKILSKTRRKKK